jgi:putative peptide zinc metalloprotease protein
VAIERPTFHESWYRVEGLHPRLRTTVQISRQHFRGQPWHVVQDHTNNAFFRLAEPAYRFVGMLDGRRSVADAWKLVNEQLGDDAPTQGEAIQLLGQLYTANLLQAEVPADAHTLFARYKKRRNREVSSYLMNIMFARVPIVDPDAFLERWIKLLGWIFAPAGFVVWMILLCLGIYAIAQLPEWPSRLMKSAGNVLDPENLIWLYVAFAVIKACHEMGHAISCKKFGRQSGTGGEVHIIGIMLLVFTPVPYVDASSSWALTNKWHRAIVGAAGMWVELGIASVAARVWANSNESGGYAWVHAFAYNVMFVASFSTVVFNANPLLRYDGYYILSDLLEIPNLAQRANDYIYYLVKRYVWNVRFARNPAYSTAEQGWLFWYAIASFLMRTLVSFSIMFYLASVLNGALIVLATAMAIAGIVTWVLVPVGKFVHYLATSGELSRVRTRAVATTLLFAGALFVAVGVIRVPHRVRAQGVIEPAEMQELFAGMDGFVQTVPTLESHSMAQTSTQPGDILAMPMVKKGALLVGEESPQLAAQKASLVAVRVEKMVERNVAAQNKDLGKAKLLDDQIDSLDEQIGQLDDQINDLQLKSPITGVFVAPEMESKQYAYLKRGDRVGLVADLHHLIVRAAATNELGGPLENEASRRVEIRVNGRPDILLTGTITRAVPSGTNELPSPALGYQVGGEFNTAPDDRNGTKTVENFFEIRIDALTLEKGPAPMMAAYAKTHVVPLYAGQRVVVRFDLKDKPIAAQLWTALLQLFQKKFKI